jgi:hypothetical protein
MFDHQLLDMIEFGVEQFKSLTEIRNSKVMEGNKPWYTTQITINCNTNTHIFAF